MGRGRPILNASTAALAKERTEEEDRMKFSKPMVLSAGCIAVLATAILSIAQSPQSASRPWLQPKNPTRLEWLALQKQANEGDTEFGENGLTVNFYLGPDSATRGLVYCDLEYLPSASAELVQLVEDGIQKRFRMEQRLSPWATVKIVKKVARTAGR